MKTTWPSGRPKGWSGFSTGLGGQPYSLSFKAAESVSLPAVATEVELGGRLGANERGAVIPFAGQIEDVGGKMRMSAGDPFDPDLLRSALLLFDRLDHPENAFVQLGPSIPPGLEDWPGYQRSHVHFSGSQLNKKFIESLALETLKALNVQEDGCWSIVRNEQSIALPPEAFGDRMGFMFRLQNALPMPDRSVSLDEVFNYKVRRSAELYALRHHIEALAIQVSKEGFGGLAETIAFEQFLAALEDHRRAISETNFLKRLTSADIKINWSNVVISAFSALPLLPHSPTAAAASFFAGNAASLLIESTLNLKTEGQIPRPFEYIFRAGKEL